MIASFLVSWVAFMFAGYFIAPLIPAVSPDPVISGYIGFFSGVVSLGIIPLVVLIWLLFKVIWGYRIGARTRRATFGIWVVAIILFAATALFSAKNYIHEYMDTEVIIENEISDLDEPLLIDLSSDYYELLNRQNIRVNFGHSFLNRDEMVLKNVTMSILPTTSNTMSIMRTSRATGSNRSDAQSHMKTINHNILSEDNRIAIPAYSSIVRGGKYRMQCYSYMIKVPVGMKVKFDGDSHMINWEDFVDQDVDLGSEYIMTEEGLKKNEVQKI